MRLPEQPLAGCPAYDIVGDYGLGPYASALSDRAPLGASRLMIRLPKQRAVLDRRALAESIADIKRGDRRAVLELAREAFLGGRKEVRRRLEDGASGAEVVAAQTFLMDQLLRVLYDRAALTVYPEPNPTMASRLSLVAIGGYGRGDLAPYSDIDVLFLHPYKLTARSEQIVEYLLYMMWDLGLKVGHATRSVADCLRRARDDMTIRTSVLESRYVWGDQPLVKEFRWRFLTELVPGTDAEFVHAKLSERDARHARSGDSRYLLEPNLKDGKGGLRDLHTLFWIAKYLYRVDRFGELVDRGVLSRREHRRFARAEGFLWRVRAHLHTIAGRAEDRLTFDVQPEIAARMGYEARRGNLAVERFMKHYFLVAKTVGELTRVFCAALEAERLNPAPARDAAASSGPPRDGLFVSGGRIAVVGDDAFEERPVRLISIFRRAQIEGRDIHPNTLRLIHQSLGLITAPIRRDAEANRILRDILTDRRDPERVLRLMNEAGVLGRFVPDFGRVVAQTQHDMYHVYTVDEHSIRAIGVLAAIEAGSVREDLPLASQLVHKIQARDALYLALFLHDVAKGRGGDHSEIGEGLARRMAERLGFAADAVETVAWLVRWHLLFSHTAFKRDPNDPKTVADFVGQIRSLERLRLLLVLTAADIMAVGPGRWNAWKGSLLRALYHRAEEVLAGGREAEGRDRRVAEAHLALRARLVDWTDEELARHEARLAAPYWLSTDPEMQERHARLVHRSDHATPVVETRVEAAKGVTEITLYAPDHSGLFTTVAGAVAAAGASIVDARIFTTDDGMALDAFWVQDADLVAFDDPDRLERLRQTIAHALANGASGVAQMIARRAQLPARTDLFPVQPHVLVDNAASQSHTVIEVSARDRPGLLYDITGALGSCGLSIGSAHISTVGTRAVDVFYVKDRYGLKLARTAEIDLVRNKLTGVLALDAGDTPRRAAV
jgi:[protein-PII] uridylyltransferase